MGKSGENEIKKSDEPLDRLELYELGARDLVRFSICRTLIGCLWMHGYVIMTGANKCIQPYLEELDSVSLLKGVSLPRNPNP